MEGPGYLVVTIQPSAQTDLEVFEDWYATEHGPLRMRLPFITSGDRYKAADGQKPEWSAVYDVSDLSMLEKRIYTRLREERSKRETQVMSTFESIDRKIYSLYSSRGGAGQEAAPVQLTIIFVVKESDLADLDRWYEEEHIEMLSRIPGWLRTRRFRLVDGTKPPAGQIECLAVHDFRAQNGLEGPEHNAARDTPWRWKVQATVLSTLRRQWNHHLTFHPLHENPSTIKTTDSATIPYTLSGPAGAPVIVCINSILTDHHIWDALAHHLTTGDRPFRILRYNPRNYDAPNPNSNPPTFHLLATDLENLLARLQIPKIHRLIGVSMGGVTALKFSLSYPHLVEKYIACDCNVASSPANSSAWDERIKLGKEEGMSALAKATVERWFTPANHGSREAETVEKMVAQASLDGFELMAGALCDYDLRADGLRDMRVPGLLVAGEGDGKLPEVMGGFAKEIPGAEFAVVKGAGHLPMVENFERFWEAVGEFL